MFTWNVVRARDGRTETVDGYESLDAVLEEMASSVWETPSNEWVNYVTGEATGEVVATAIFGPGLELLVTFADGRRMNVPMPERYRQEVPNPSIPS